MAAKDDLSNFMEHFARITGCRFTKIEEANGETNMSINVPLSMENLSAMLAGIPAAILSQKIEEFQQLGKVKKAVPPNDKFEGKKRF